MKQLTKHEQRVLDVLKKDLEQLNVLWKDCKTETLYGGKLECEFAIMLIENEYFLEQIENEYFWEQMEEEI